MNAKDELASGFDAAAEATKSIFHIDELKQFLTVQNIVKASVGIFTVLLFYIIYRIIKTTVKRRAVSRMQPRMITSPMAPSISSIGVPISPFLL